MITRVRKCQKNRPPYQRHLKVSENKRNFFTKDTIIYSETGGRCVLEEKTHALKLDREIRILTGIEFLHNITGFFRTISGIFLRRSFRKIHKFLHKIKKKTVKLNIKAMSKSE